MGQTAMETYVNHLINAGVVSINKNEIYIYDRDELKRYKLKLVNNVVNRIFLRDDYGIRHTVTWTRLAGRIITGEWTQKGTRISKFHALRLGIDMKKWK